MDSLIIDNDFKNLIPPLTDDEFAQLEKNILRDGIRDPLVVWKNTLIDGHNRHKIAQQHNLPFSVTEMQFLSRNDAIIWIIKNQFGRRNLTAYDRSILALKLKPIIAAKAKEKSLANLKQNTEVKNSCPRLDESPQPPKPVREQKTDFQVAKAAGVSEDTIRKVEKIEKAAPQEVKAALKTGNISINEAYRRTKNLERAEDIKRQVADIEQKALQPPNDLYDVIAIDPPWGYAKQANHCDYDIAGRRVASPYPEMSQDELKKLKIPAADNCVLFLWTTHQFIWDAKELLDNWGFNYRCMFVWNKKQMGMGNLIRLQCEFCLIAIKGKPLFKDVHDVRDLIEEPRREHSRKPEEFYRLVDNLCVGRKLDFFSRTIRKGWDSYGNDIEKFSLV